MRCLLIAPLHFYGFAKGVASGLAERGYEVVLKNEEYPTGTWGRVVGYFATGLIRKSTYTYFKKLVEAEERFDLVLIIKGRGMSQELIELFRSKGSCVVGYNYDSFKRNPAPLVWYRSVDLYTTFDIEDAIKFDLKLVHLFSAVPRPESREKTQLLSVIQRRHSDRLKHGKRIIDVVPEDQRFVYFFEWSLLTQMVGFLRSPMLYLRMRRFIFMTPLGYQDAMSQMARSKVTFDYAYPGQSGITVRCFEAQSLGTAILTNNRHAVESGLFQSGSIAYLAPDATPEEIRRSLDELAAQLPIPKSRTLDHFLDDLLREASSA